VSSYREYLEQASAEYHAQMRRQSAPDGVRRYLTEHAIMDREIVDKYQLGYVSEPLPGDDMYSGRLVIPYLGRGGVAAVKFRLIEGSGPKYLHHKGQKARLYNTEAYHTAQHTIGLCEGEVDAIVATERLNIPTMGIPGVDVWQARKDIWTPLFRDFRLVVVFVDGDDAGGRLGDDVAESLGTRARIVHCDPGQDVSSMIVAGHADKLSQMARA
jgi:DNA primase